MATEDPQLGGRRTVPATSGGGYPPEADLEGEAVSGRSSGGVPRVEEAGAGSCPPGAGERGLRDDGEDQIPHVGEDNGFLLYEKVDSKEREGVRQLPYAKYQEDERKCKLETREKPDLLQVGGDEMGEEGEEQTVTKKNAVLQELHWPAASNPLTLTEDCNGRGTSEGLLLQVKNEHEEIHVLTARLEKTKSDAARLEKIMSGAANMREHNRRASQEVVQLKDQLKAARKNSNYVNDQDLSCVVGERAFMDENMKQMKLVNLELIAKVMVLEEDNERLRKETNSLTDTMKRFRQVSSDLAAANIRIHRLKEEITQLRHKNDELQSQAALANAQATVFKEDFQTERTDREKAAVRYEEQKEKHSRRVEELRQHLQIANDELKHYKDLVESLEVVKEKSEHSLQQAHKEIQVKSRQVKQFKKQVDSLKEQTSSRELEFWNMPRTDVHIVSEIGRGGWGTVFKGTFQGQVIAIKQIHPDILMKENIQRLHREVCMMAKVRHPNLLLFIAAVFDGDVEKLRKPPLIVMELLDMDLRKAYLTNQILSSTRIPIFRDVAFALNYLHNCREPIIHRDVSAPNVLLEALANNQWKAKVSDFGSANLAKFAKTTAEGAIIYSAPETLPDEIRDPRVPTQQTPKIDVYSYGVLLCEVITSRQPDQFKQMKAEVQKKWPFMHSLITSCTNRFPDDRPTMAQVIKELQKLP